MGTAKQAFKSWKPWLGFTLVISLAALLFPLAAGQSAEAHRQTRGAQAALETIERIKVIALEHGQFKAAVDGLTLIAERTPDPLLAKHAVFAMADLYLEQGKPADAIDVLARYAASLPVGAPAPPGISKTALPKPIVHWSFDDPANVLRDVSGNGHDLEVPGKWSTVPGVAGKAIRFEDHSPGSTNWGRAPEGPHASTGGMVYPTARGFTVSCWVKGEAGFGGVSDYWQHRAGGETFGLFYRRDGYGTKGKPQAVFMVRHDFTNPPQIVVSAPESERKGWVHLVGVYDPNGPCYRLYVNGRSVGEQKMPGPMRTSRPPNIFVAGSWHDTRASIMDDVRIYSVALSDEQIRLLHRRPAAATAATATSETARRAASFGGLGDLPRGAAKSYAYGVSANGRFVVGDSVSSREREAFLWSAETGMALIGDLPEAASRVPRAPSRRTARSWWVSGQVPRCRMRPPAGQLSREW